MCCSCCSCSSSCEYSGNLVASLCAVAIELAVAGVGVFKVVAAVACAVSIAASNACIIACACAVGVLVAKEVAVAHAVAAALALSDLGAVLCVASGKCAVLVVLACAVAVSDAVAVAVAFTGVGACAVLVAFELACAVAAAVASIVTIAVAFAVAVSTSYTFADAYACEVADAFAVSVAVAIACSVAYAVAAAVAVTVAATVAVSVVVATSCAVAVLVVVAIAIAVVVTGKVADAVAVKVAAAVACFVSVAVSVSLAIVGYVAFAVLSVLVFAFSNTALVAVDVAYTVACAAPAANAVAVAVECAVEIAVLCAVLVAGAFAVIVAVAAAGTCAIAVAGSYAVACAVGVLDFVALAVAYICCMTVADAFSKYEEYSYSKNRCGRETHTTAVFGGGRAGHPPSTASNCQESGVGDLAPTLVGATGSASPVVDLVRGASNAIGKEKKEMRTAGTSQGTQKGKSPKRYSTAWVKRAKRVRHLVYTSSSEEEVLGFREEKRSIPEGPPVTGIETKRLIEIVKDCTLEAETERKRCGKIKGDVSGHVKRGHNDVLQIVRVLGDRLGTVGNDSVPDAVAQLRAENKLIMERNKFLTEEVARLKREMKRRDVLPGNSAPAEIVSAVSAASESASGVIKVGHTVNKPVQRSIGEERLATAREEESMDLRAIANWIRSLARSQVKMQQNLDSLMGKRSSYAQVAATTPPTPPPPVATATVGGEGEDGFTKEVAWPGNGQGLSPGAKEGSQRNRSRRNRESAVVFLTCDKEESYREALQKIQEKVNFLELEIKNLPCRRGLTGSFIWQVRGKGADAKADKMAQVLKGALPEAKINRPQRISPFRLIGILPNASHSDIERGLLEIRSETNLGLIKIGDMQADRGGLGEVTVVASAALGRAAVKKGKIIIGFSSARVLALRQKPLKCHRCLAKGHVAASCPSTKTRAGVCFICGEPGHIARTCKNKVRCPVCVKAGRAQTGHRAGSWECLKPGVGMPYLRAQGGHRGPQR
ncbi:hypothetical protein M0804_006791 [Polistes exclamans]|nr:hypothetical protein M0804_006791 [Polistes exclamans]